MGRQLRRAKSTPGSSLGAASLGATAASSFLAVPQEDDTDAHEDADEVDEQLYGVPREVSVAEGGLLHDELGVEDHVTFCFSVGYHKKTRTSSTKQKTEKSVLMSQRAKRTAVKLSNGICACKHV